MTSQLHVTMNGYRSTSINVYCVHSVTVSHVVREVHIDMVVHEKLNNIFTSVTCCPPKWRLSFLYHVNKRETILYYDCSVLGEVDIGAMSEQDVHYFTMTLSYCSDQSCLSKVILCETRQLIQSAKFINAPPQL